MALLRFVDPSEGKIVIDGIDIRTIGLQDLRSRIVRSVIYPLASLTVPTCRLSYPKIVSSSLGRSGA